MKYNLYICPPNNLKIKIMNTQKTKRPRIKQTLPEYTRSIDFRLKQIKAELCEGLSPFEAKWLLIQNEVATLKK